MSPSFSRPLLWVMWPPTRIASASLIRLPLLTSSVTAYPNLPVTAPWLGSPLHRSPAVCSGCPPPFFPPGIHLGRLCGELACSQDNRHLGEGKTPNGPIQSTSGVSALSRYSPSCPGLRGHFLPTSKTVTPTPSQ